MSTDRDDILSFLMEKKFYQIVNINLVDITKSNHFTRLSKPFIRKQSLDPPNNLLESNPWILQTIY